jgi:glutamine---fructose-6-phosphate transaminase (isomerizing)
LSLLSEIEEQPASIARALEGNLGVYDEVARLAARCTHVVIAARGTSDNAARYAQYVWGLRNRMMVALATPSLFSVYGKPPRLEGSLVVGISQSGQSPDIVAVLKEGRAQGRPVVAITNDTGSPLADAGDVVVPLHAGAETAVAATKTYTSQLAVVAALSEAMAGRAPAIGELSDVVARVLEGSDSARSAAEAMGGFEHAAVLGRGFNLATAFEWALKMQELSYVVAQPFSTADFLHGPIAVVDRGYPVLAVVADGPAADEVVGALDRSRSRGAPTLTLTNLAGLPGPLLEFPEVEEWLSPIPAIVLAQLFTYWLTVAQGNDPDHPRGLSKVTRTT